MNDTDRYSTGIAPIAKMLIRSGDDLVVVHLKFDENAGPSDGASEAIVEKVSMDLSTTEQLLSYTQEEAYEFGQSIPVSADRDGNILFLTILPDENFENVSLSFMTMNKDGEVIATLSTENLLDINDIGDLYGDPETLPRILDEFTIVTPAKNKLVQLSPQLTEKATYAMAQDEVINDAVALTDGSLAGVGRSYASTANYEINGTVNGTYLRLTAKVSPSGTTNPNTLDDAGMMTIFGATAAVIAAGAVALVSKRR